jgi:hypothetical protein
MSYQQQPYGQAPYPPQQPPKKRTSPWLIGCGIAAVVGVLVVGGCVAVIGVAANKATHYTPAPSAPVVPGSGGKAKAAGMGNPVKDGKFTFTVTKVAPGPHTIGSAGFGKTAQGKFVYVYVTVANHATEAQSFSGDSQKLLAGSSEYSADTEAAVYLPDSQSLWTDINPGNTVKGIIIFDVPKNVTPSAIVLHDSPFSNGVKVALK